MRKIGSTCDYICARNRELTQKAMRLAVSRGVTLDKVADEVADSEASRFWVDEDRAIELYHEHRRGVRQRRPERERMAGEIRRRTEAYMSLNPEASLAQAVNNVIHSPAPSFYIRGRSVKRAVAARKRGYIPEYRMKTTEENDE